MQNHSINTAGQPAGCPTTTLRMKPKPGRVNLPPRPVRRGIFSRYAIGTLVLGLVPFLATAADNPSVPDTARLVTEWMPAPNFYPHYIADPLRPQSALTILWMADSDIPESGESRFGLRLGGRWGIVRWHPEGEPDRGWQIDFEGGYFGHFDMDHSLDNIGWDGLFGLYLSWLPREDLGFRTGIKHDSAHVGDEYAERTGRERIGYTRQEVVAGVNWRLTPKWQVYAEGGVGFDLDDFQDPGRVQAGIEYYGSRTFWKQRMTWYAALDLQSFQELDWNTMSTAQLGFLLPTGRGTSRFRLAIEVGTGRSALGEFSFHDGTYFGVGWYYDF